jgi:predicted ribosome quality control (RQC) complex YloA/Tae2 family protein
VLSLQELRRATRLVSSALEGARLVRSLQLGRFELVLVLEGRERPRRKQAVLLSCEPHQDRLSLLPEPPPAPKQLPPLCQFLRAHVVGGRLVNASVAEADRIASLRFETSEGSHCLRLALMGGRSNVYLLDPEDRVRMTLRPIEKTRRDLVLGDVWRDPQPRRVDPGEDRFQDVPDGEFFEALEARAGDRADTDRSEEQVTRLRRLLRRRRQNLERKFGLLEGDLDAGDRAARAERAGELLKSNLHQVKRGAEELVVEDPASGGPITISLDPALSPGANVEALFRRYRKELRRASRAGDAIQGVREQLDGIVRRSQELEVIVEQGADAAALEAFAQAPEVARLLERARPPQASAPARERRKPGLPARFLPRRYRSASGLEIWVGKSDEGNDHLTTRLARGNDLFFHLEGSPGSHVILRTEGRTDPPSEAVLEACELAVHFSKQRGSSRASVHIVPIKQVRKPKGAKPGLVMVHGGRTISLRHEPARLKRILEALAPDS